MSLFTDADLLMFERIGVTTALLAAAQVQRVTDEEARERVATNGSRDLTGIFFPYLNPCNGQRTTARIRRDHPEVENDKIGAKYISSWGDRRHLYFPPDCADALLDTSIPVVIVESEKAVLAGTAWAERTGKKHLFVGCGGCWGWRGKIGKVLLPNGSSTDEKGALPDFHLMAFQEREAIICFDSNVSDNESVRRAQFALADDILCRGAVVKLATVPNYGSINGPDDLIWMAGSDALTAILDTARPTAKVAKQEAERAIESVTQENSGERLDEVLAVVAQVGSKTGRDLLLSTLQPKTKLRDKPLREALERQEKLLRQQRDLTSATIRVGYLKRLHVDPAQIVSDLENFFDEYVWSPQGTSLLLALWTINTYCFHLFDVTPYLLLGSATWQCGKTTLLQCLGAVVRSPLRVEGLKEATLYRLIDKDRPTLLIDEAEMLKGNDDRANYLRSILNAGYKSGSAVPRCTGRDYSEITYFDVYCPKAFSLIGSLSGALLDRCIIIRLEQKPPEIKLVPVKEQLMRAAKAKFSEVLEAYAVQASERLTALYKDEPTRGYWPELGGNRESELYRPLLLHARLGGPELENLALETALLYSRKKRQDVVNQPEFERMREFVEAIQELGKPRFTAKEITLTLRKGAWAAHLEGRGENSKAAEVGRFLKNFDLQPEHSRDGNRYISDQVIEKLCRHLPVDSDNA